MAADPGAGVASRPAVRATAPTRLEALCDATLEAGWLLLLVVVPLLFNPYSWRVFEPEKTALVRSVALVMAAAWLTRLLAGGPAWRPVLAAAGASTPDRRMGRSVRRALRLPLLAPALLLVGANLASATFSIAPRISWWGSYQRSQGAISTLACFWIFLMILGNLRRTEQWRRLVLAVVLTGAAVALYAVLQSLGLDPLPWASPFGKRVASTLGNPIFASAFLLFPALLTLDLVIGALGRPRSDPAGRRDGSRIAAAIVLGAILAVDAWAMTVAASRGPVLALLVGVGLFCLMRFVARPSPDAPAEDSGRAAGVRGGGLWLAGLAASAAVAAALLLAGLPRSPLGALTRVPVVGRLGTAADPTVASSQTRMLIWEGMAALVGPHPPLPLADDGDDPRPGVRALLGYGPETQSLVLGPYYSPELARLSKSDVFPDRAHNEVLDAIACCGGLGLLGFLGVVVAILSTAAAWLGCLESRGQARLLTLMLALGGIGAAGAAALSGRGLALAAPALPLGLVLGFGGFLALAAAARRGLPTRPTTPHPELLAALAAALVAHVVETDFGIAVTATRTYFWVFAAALVVVGAGWLEAAEGTEPRPAPVAADQDPGAARAASLGASTVPVAPEWRRALVTALLGSAALVALTSGMIAAWQASRAAGAAGGQVAALARTARFGPPLLLALSAVLFAALYLVDRPGSPGTGVLRARLRHLDLLAIGGLAPPVMLVLWLAARRATTLALAKAAELESGQADLARLVRAVAGSGTALWLTLAAVGVLLVLALWFRPGDRRRWSGRPAWLVTPAGLLLAAGALALSGGANVRPLAADALAREALVCSGVGRPEWGVALLDAAAAFQSQADEVLGARARIGLAAAQAATSDAARGRWFAHTVETLVAARRMNALEPTHEINLARAYFTWAALSTDEGLRAVRFRLAYEHYTSAMRARPTVLGLRDERALAAWAGVAGVSAAPRNDPPGGRAAGPGRGAAAGPLPPPGVRLPGGSVPRAER